MKKFAALESKLLVFIIFFALPLGILALFFPSPIKAYIISPPSLSFDEKVFDDTNLDGRDLLYRFGIFNDVLYAGVGNIATNSASIYKSSTGDADSWSEVASFSNDDSHVWDLQEFGGYFYASTGSFSSDPGVTIAEILRSSDGENWVDIIGHGPEATKGEGFDDSDNYRIDALEPFGGYLYTGTENLGGGQIWRTQNGTDWDKVADAALGGLGNIDANESGVVSLYSSGNYLYAGTFNSGGASIYRTSNGTVWTKVGSGGLGNPNNTVVPTIVSYLGVFYAGTFNFDDGLELYYSLDGTSWNENEVDLGYFTTLPNIWSSLQPTIVNGLAYSGTEGKEATNSAQLYVTDGADATQIGEDGFGDPNNFGLYALTFFKGRVYAGLSNEYAPNCLQIRRSEELPTLSITTNQNLNTALVGRSYSTTLNTSNGTSPYTFSLISGSLPPGLQLSSSGLIYGTPTHNSSYSFTVRVTDGGFPAQTYDKAFVMGVSTGLPETGFEGRKSPSTGYTLTMLTILLTAIAAVNLMKNRKFNLKSLSIKKLPLFGRVLLIIILSAVVGTLFNIPNQLRGPNISFSLKPILAANPTYPAPPDLDQRFQKFGLSIDKIGLKVPITENVDGTEKSAYENPLLLGLAHYSGTALPSEGGNIFLFGHSTAGPVTNSYYGYAFSKISELSRGDKLVLTKNGQEFTYAVTEKKIVQKDDLSVLEPTDNEVVTLMTCWPAGKLDSRLIIRASLI